eukprot:5444181-Pyramimonas_sp.AAC.1
MKDRAIILIQETHGTTEVLRTLLNATPFGYQLFHSSTGRSGAGGVAILVPLPSRMTAQSAPLEDQPSITHEVLADGR